MNIENLSSIATIIGGGFFGGVLIGYALKKVVKVVAIVVGLFLAGLAYLQYQQIVAINWNKVPQLSQNAIDVDYMTDSVIIDYDPLLITKEEIKNKLEKSGYKFVRVAR